MDFNTDVLYTPHEVQQILRIGRNTIYSLLKSGILPSMKIGGYKIRKSELEAFVEKYQGFNLSDLKHITKVTD